MPKQIYIYIFILLFLRKFHQVTVNIDIFHLYNCVLKRKILFDDKISIRKRCFDMLAL